MNLNRKERDWYRLDIMTNPPQVGTWQGSFDEGFTWVDGTQSVEGLWCWLLAGPEFDASSVGLDPSDTDAVIIESVTSLLRIKEDPVLNIETGTMISLR